MQVTTSYHGRSSFKDGTGAAILRLAPDLGRDRVQFDAALAQPLRFREAISALHDVVINDLRFVPRDKTAYQEWRAERGAIERAIYEGARAEAAADLASRMKAPLPEGLEASYKSAKGRYWKARRGFNTWLRKSDPTLWRQLMPYDPVVTVADDTVLFECFSADESSYGCLSVARDGGFRGDEGTAVGTTNVDYSWQLYDHFQQLRSYRATRFQVDPEGFEVATGGGDGHREEKIDLPEGWLRGFSQIQAAMALPMRRVPLTVAAVYSLLAYLKRHKAKTSPRAVRFELEDGATPKLVLEPWEKAIESHGTKYSGPSAVGPNAIRIWGRRRLLVLSRLLPLADGVDVYLLGTGLPTFWVVRMGEMRLTLGLSGWTTNDWTRGSAIDSFLPPVDVPDRTVAALATALQSQRRLDFAGAAAASGGTEAESAAALGELALRGQAIYDLGAGCYRWRQVLDMALSDRELGDSNPEQTEAALLVARKAVTIEGRVTPPSGGTIANGRVDGIPCEVKFEDDGRVVKGKCLCSHHHKFGIRNGPCRHIQAMRDVVRGEAGTAPDLESWYTQRKLWARG